MTKKELNYWFMYTKQVENGYHMEKEDWRDFNRLNHLVMEASHKIHNDNMLKF